MADATCPECDELLQSIPLAVNTAFLVTMAILIFLMQAGFAFIEAGSVRAKNTTNILVKNVIDSILGTIVYWSIGYAFAFGSTNNGMIGTNKFFLINTPASEYKDFFFQYVFAVTSATIVSGAIAERATLHSYLIFTVFMTGLIYPVVTHWVWCENGWLLNLGFIDYAGSAVVHIVGGAAALAGTLIVGPRIGRFEKGRILPIPGHSTVLITLGYFLLWFGFFAFNGGSEGGIAGEPFDPDNVARAVVNTALSGAAGTLTTLFILKLAFTKTTYSVFGKEFKTYTIFGGYWSLTGAVNGGICGMAAICSACAMVEPWAGVVIGCVAGAAYCWWTIFFLNLHVDDPVHACAIHIGGGLWGPLAAALFCHPDRSSSRLGGDSFLIDGGIIYGSSDAFIAFGVQCIGCAVIFFWSFVCSAAVFGTLRLLGWFRVSAVAEEDGLDFINGEPAYPIDPAILGSSTYNSEDNYGTDDTDDLPKT